MGCDTFAMRGARIAFNLSLTVPPHTIIDFSFGQAVVNQAVAQRAIQNLILLFDGSSP